MVGGFHLGDLDVLSPCCLQFLLRYFKRQVDDQFPFVTRRCRWEERERGDCILREEDTVDEALLLVTGRLRSTHKQLRDGSKYKLQYRLSYDGGRCFSEKEKDEMTRKMQVRSSEETVSGWEGVRGVNRGMIVADRSVVVADCPVVVDDHRMIATDHAMAATNHAMTATDHATHTSPITPSANQCKQSNESTIPDEVVVSVSNDDPA